MKQTSLAFSMYTADYDDTFPAGASQGALGNQPEDWIWWQSPQVICARYRLSCGLGAMEAVIDIHAYAGRALVEVVSGQTLGAFLQQHILGPLGMVDTAFHVPEGKHHRQAQCYQKSGSGALVPLGGRDFRQPPAAPSGGGYACAFTLGFNAAGDLLEKIDGTLVDTYAARTGGEKEQITDWMAAETWFTAEEAVQHGFADKVAGLHGAQAVLAYPLRHGGRRDAQQRADVSRLDRGSLRGVERGDLGRVHVGQVGALQSGDLGCGQGFSLCRGQR